MNICKILVAVLLTAAFSGCVVYDEPKRTHRHRQEPGAKKAVRAPVHSANHALPPPPGKQPPPPPRR